MLSPSIGKRVLKKSILMGGEAQRRSFSGVRQEKLSWSASEGKSPRGGKRSTKELKTKSVVLDESLEDFLKGKKKTTLG